MIASPTPLTPAASELLHVRDARGVHTLTLNMLHEVAQEGVLAFIEKRQPQWSA